MAHAPNSPTQSSRLLGFDLLRGYFLVGIILNHLSWYPSGLDVLTVRGALFVTAAEGFFLLSGIILGIIRGRKLIAEPFIKGARLLLKRGVQLYIVSIILMLLFTLLGWWFFMDNPGLKPGIRPADQPFLEVLWGALTFEYIYGWADFLRLYAIFLIVSPIALWLLRKKLWYVLLALSVGVWSLFPLALETQDKTAELLMPISWQLIFFGGLTVGFYWQTIMDWWKRQTTRFRTSVTATVVSVSIATILMNAVLSQYALFPGIIGQTLEQVWTALGPYFTKESLPIPRLLLFMLWIGFGYWLVTRFQAQIVRWFGWLLIPFGTHSLYVYILHAVLIFFAHLIVQGATPSPIISLIGSITIIALILLAIRTKFLMRIIPR